MIVCLYFFSFLFLLVIVLSILLRFTDSDDPFLIFKLFLDSCSSIYCFLCRVFSTIVCLFLLTSVLLPIMVSDYLFGISELYFFIEEMIWYTFYSKLKRWAPFLVIVHWHYSPQVEIQKCRDNQSRLSFLNAAYLSEKQQISILVFAFIWPWIEYNIDHIKTYRLVFVSQLWPRCPHL